MPIKLKMKVYKTMVRLVLLFGAETWAVGKREEQLMRKTEMRMLRWSFRLTLKDRIKNEEVRRRAGVVNIKEKMKGQDAMVRRRREEGKQ